MGQEEALEGDGYFYGLDSGYVFPSVHLSPNNA